MSVRPDREIMTKRKPEDSPAASFQPATPDFIGDSLRRLFKDVESEPLPDRFKELLRKLADGDEDDK